MTWAGLRRRGWIIPVTAVATALVALLVSGLVPKRHVAEATLVVPVARGDLAVGSIEQATALASTYARLLRSDVDFLRHVSTASAVPLDRVADRIALRATPGTPILRMRMSASQRERAERGVAAMARGISGDTPVSRTVAPNVVRVMRLPGRARLDPDASAARRYTAEAVAIVRPGAASAFARDATDASTLARTFATLIPKDPTILGRTAEATGLRRAQVRDRLSVTVEFETALLFVRFSDPDARRARTGARTVARAVSGPEPASPRIPPRAISAVELPRTAPLQSSVARNALPIGLALGLCLGAILALAAERAFPRADDADALSYETGRPASTLEHLPSLAAQWARMGAGRRPARVVVRPASREDSRAAAATAERLLTVPLPHDAARLDVHLAGPPGAASYADPVAVSGDVLVLVTERGRRIATVRRAMSVLEQMGTPPAYSLLVPPGLAPAHTTGDGDGGRPGERFPGPPAAHGGEAAELSSSRRV